MVNKKFFKTKDDCEVAFELVLDDADQVALVCDVNDWDPIPMKKNKKGAFRTKMRMPKGQRIQFRYLVDKQNWINDETADAIQPNQFGGMNSVLDTTPATEPESPA